VPIGGGGSKYGYAQLEGLWINAGGPARMAPLMAAIAEAESGGNPRARNPSGASGLWQILGNPFPGDPFNPETNARMAVAKWKSQGLGAWVTYTSGAYKRFLRKGVSPDLNVGGGGYQIGYRNPLRNVRGLVPERIDQGVDYSGSGPVFALAPGRIVSTTNPGWPGGGFITERITGGPLAGKYWYTAENIRPQVQVGQQVTGGTVIGQMTGGIETGFAAPPPHLGESLARLEGQWSSSQQSTGYGVAASDVLKLTGAPPGIATPGQAVTGTRWPPPWLVGIIAGANNVTGGSGVPGVPGAGIADAISNLTNALGGIFQAVDWLLQPSNWVRIIAGVGGGTLVLVGVFNLSGGRVAGAGPPRSVQLPLGILFTWAGAVLLFVAFHNLEAGNIGEVLGTLRDKAQAASAPKATP